MKFIAVTNRGLCKIPFLEQLEKIMELSEEDELPKPDMLILREKDLKENEYEALAKEVLSMCHEFEVECILHTYTGAAQRLGCGSIHLPLPVLETMEKNGEWKEIRNCFEKKGVSVHSAEEARRAACLGADYLTAGHVFATDCKKGVPPRGLPFLEAAAAAAHEIKETLPVYGIGGMDRGKVPDVAKTGAGGICIMSGYMKI